MSVSKEHRETFFTFLFEDLPGYLTIASIKEGKFNKQLFFVFPDELDQAIEYIESLEDEYNVYFSAQLFRSKSRRKDNINKCNFLWADLDTCSPKKLLIEPTIVLETSKGRYQAFWKLSKEVAPEVAEDLSKRIAYRHSEDGADEGGWDLSQLLRVPYSTNFNHEGNPNVRILIANRNVYSVKDVTNAYQPVEKLEWLDEPPPEISNLQTIATIFTKVGTTRLQLINKLFESTPDKDWSKPLWQLIKCCLEAGLEKEETFNVAYHAKCNKYKRDHRPYSHLWRDILKAYANKQPVLDEEDYEEEEDLDLDLLTDGEKKRAESQSTLIERFIEYGAKATDADTAYHKGNVFMILSCLLSSKLRIEVDQSLYIPNLWLIILGESTYTRKSTALNLAKKFIEDIDPDCLLATDASPQGILDGMAGRPNRNSLFFRDEFQGLIKAICKADYMTGMTETFTSLYNGDDFKRRLARGEVVVRKPVFILWGGGIREEILSHLTNENVTSGFVPRFLFVSGKTDISKIRLRGKRNEDTSRLQEELYHEFVKLFNYYNNSGVNYFSVELTDEAVDLMNRVEAKFIEMAFNSEVTISSPIFDRALVNGIKMAGLIAALRMDSEEGRLYITRDDMELAFHYLEQFLPSSIDVVNNIGVSISEKQVRRALDLIIKNNGVARSRLMKSMRLESRRADEIIRTLEERNQVFILNTGRGIKICPKGL